MCQDPTGLFGAEFSGSFADGGILRAEDGGGKERGIDRAGLPMASVPTGTPLGICAIERSESRPLRAFDSTGTPRTGRTVFEAVMPGRCAAPPAPAMMTSMPRLSALEAYLKSRSGVRWAETTRVSCGTPRALSVLETNFMVSQSEPEPMMMPTRG